MALNDHKITGFAKPVSALADKPQMSAAELKAWFDSNSTNEVKNAINGIIDTLVAAGGAAQIGSTGGNVQIELDRRVSFQGSEVRFIRLSADKVLEVSADGISWQTTAAGGHAIVDSGGTVLPQRGRVRFENAEVTDRNGETVVRAVRSGEDLLDNGYFADPIDQRRGYVTPPLTSVYNDAELSSLVGQSAIYYNVVEKNDSYVKVVNESGGYFYAAASDCVRGYTENSYTIDRWQFDNNSGNATILLTESGIKFVNGSAATGVGAIHQKLPPEIYSYLAGKTITISILGESEKNQQALLLVNGSIYAINYSKPDSSNLRVTTLTATLPQTISDMRAFLYGASEAGAGEGYIKAAKLELGTVQTLAHQDENGNWVLNEIPDYGEQLARCQRYLIKMIQYDRYRASYILPDHIGFTFPVVTTMRTVPSLIGNGLTVTTITGEQVTGFTFNVALVGSGDIMIRAVKVNHGLSDATLYVQTPVLLSADL